MHFARLGYGDRDGRARRSGLDPSHPALVAAERWLLENQILGPGDWQVKNPKAAPGGWAFEFRNDFYPGRGRHRVRPDGAAAWTIPIRPACAAAIRRGTGLAVSMQNSDGGWGAFDHDNNLQFLNHIPFADHNAMIDPSTADVTARVLECLGQFGWPANASGGRAGAWNSAARSDAGRLVVRPLGRELRLRDERRACAPWKPLGLSQTRRLPARRGLAALGAEFRRRIRRIDRFLLRSGAEGQRARARRRRRRGG